MATRSRAPPRSSIKADKEVVLAAVEQNGRALWHASEELQADEEVIRASKRE